MVTIRSADVTDLDAIVDLWRLSFAPLQSNLDLRREWLGEPPKLDGRRLFLAQAESTGQPVGAFSLLDLQMHFAGTLLPLLGVAGVAVAPTQRGQGLARTMMTQAVKEARSRQVPLSMLYPFQHGFYRRLGWAWVGETRQYRVCPRQLPSAASSLDRYTPEKAAAVQALYAQVAATQNGWLQRQPWQWERWQKLPPGKEIYLYQAAGQVQGYLLLEFAEVDAPNPTLAAFVQEWVAQTGAAYRALLGFVAGLRDQVPLVIWNTSPTDPFPQLLTNQQQHPAIPSPSFSFALTLRLGAIGAGFMWRLVDLSQALTQRPIQPGPPFAVTVQIADPILGQQVLTLDCADGQMQLRSTSAPTTIALSIAHLTQLYAGVRTATELHWLGELELTGDRAILAQLDAAWRTPSPFCWDFF